MSAGALHIAFEGLPGVGKSTLGRRVADALRLQFYPEPVESNPYLADFYADPSAHPMMQCWLLEQRLRQHQQIVASRAGGVQDRTIYADRVFWDMLRADGKMTDRDYNTLCALTSTTTLGLAPPDVIVFLDASPETCRLRMHTRDRDCESGVPLAYLQNLRAAYLRFLEEMSRTVFIVRVPWEEFASEDALLASVLRVLAQPRPIPVVHPLSASQERMALLDQSVNMSE